MCCHSALNEKEVLVITEKVKEKIDTTIWDSSVSDEKFHDPRKQGRNFVCKSCFKEMSQNKKMPTKSRKNGLTVEKLPPELADLTEMENQMIAPYLLFMKIKKVPRSGIEMMLVRTVLVPVEPTDILNNVEKMLLPRTLAESAVVSIDFKRMKDMKNTHKTGCVRPIKMI